MQNRTLTSALTMLVALLAAVALVLAAAPAEARHRPYRNEGRSLTSGFQSPALTEPTKGPGFPGPVHPCFQEPCPPAGS